VGGYHGVGEKSLFNVLKKGKETIEGIIASIDASYQCTALRAGGYNIQPSHDIIKVMRDLGMKIDTSVFPGGREIGTLSRFDYSSLTNNKGYWYVDNDVATEALQKTNIVELPIVAYPMKRIKKYLTISRLKNYFKNAHSALDTLESKMSKKNIWSKISYFWGEEWQTWDYCLFSKGMHKAFIKKSDVVHSEHNRNIFVLVGHPKGLTDISPLIYLINYAKKQGYGFDTLSGAYRRYIDD
jgi:hypothetical protein